MGSEMCIRDSTYSIEVAHIDVGDTIEWLPNVDHNVEFLGGPNMNSLPEKSGFNSFYKVNFDLPGVYLYHCTPHGNMGMLGLVIVGNNFHNLKDIEKIKLSPVGKSVLEKLIKEYKEMQIQFPEKERLKMMKNLAEG